MSTHHPLGFNWQPFEGAGPKTCLSVKVIEFALEFVDPNNQGTDMKTRLGASLGATKLLLGANPEVKASDDPVMGSQVFGSLLSMVYKWYILPIGGFLTYILGGVKPSIFSMGFRVQGFFVGYKDWHWKLSKYMVYPQLQFYNFWGLDLFWKVSFSCVKEQQRCQKPIRIWTVKAWNGVTQ